MSYYAFSRLFHIVAEPVGGEVVADLPVVDMGVLGAAFLGGEDLDGLVLRAAASCNA